MPQILWSYSGVNDRKLVKIGPDLAVDLKPQSDNQPVYSRASIMFHQQHPTTRKYSFKNISDFSQKYFSTSNTTSSNTVEETSTFY